MSVRFLWATVLVVAGLGFSLPADASEPLILASPGDVVSARVSVQQKLEPNPPGERLYYSVDFRGQSVLLDSPFGLELRESPPLGVGVSIERVETRSVDQEWRRVWGKRTRVVDRYNEMTLHLVESEAPRRQVELVFRAYDDGVAFRYVLPDQEALRDFELTAERSTFRFPGNPTVWAMRDEFVSPHEGEFEELRIDSLAPTSIYNCPMLVRVAPSVYAALTEANLTDWAGMYLTPASDRLGTLVSVLSPRRDDPGVAVRSRTPRSSPWRVLMLGEEPGDLIESDMIQNLNEPAAIDTSWIEPGIAAWDRWWSGSYAPEVDFEVGMNTDTMKYYVDLAAEMGWEYQLVDWNWYGPPFADGAFNTTWAAHPDADITRVVSELDLPELIRYAGERNVEILLWLHWSSAVDQMDRAFALYETWGVRGVKLDFMNRDDQEMVQLYHRIVKKAAQHHLLVDFHGAYKPTGWSRTYPNLITREGVLGNENTKWSARVTPDHCLTIPFTRGLLGEMDFTPGGFRHKTQETFRVVGGDAPGPFVMGTRAFQLAMNIVYESALQVMCDSPYSYRSSPAGLDFLRLVPTTWDDTRVIHGQVGDFITVARRSDQDWYVGSMTDGDARNLEIPLSFLGAGRYRAQIWADAYEAGEYPDRLRHEEREVTADDALTAAMVSGGGHVVRLSPIDW
jgi:alpha-glucosidase